jgi:hypothetical protein
MAGDVVKRRKIHGTMPIKALGTTDDLGAGRLLPSTAVMQYASSLGG